MDVVRSAGFLWVRVLLVLCDESSNGVQGGEPYNPALKAGRFRSAELVSSLFVGSNPWWHLKQKARLTAEESQAAKAHFVNLSRSAEARVGFKRDFAGTYL